MIAFRSTLAAAAALLVAALPAAADTIFLVDGRTVDDVSVKDELLSVVTYREGSKDREVPADQILRIEYERTPQAIGEAEALVAEGDVSQALIELGYYIDASLSTNPDRKFPWGPAMAAKRVIEINASTNQLAATQAAALDLIARFPDSRHVPSAYLAKAEAQTLAGARDNARGSLSDLLALANDRDLSERYTLAARVELAAIDEERSGADRIEALEQIEGDAGSRFPTVRDRSLVAQGEVYLEMADADPSNASDLLDSAQVAFQAAFDSEGAEPATRAGATVGLADCIFRVASPANEKEGLQQAQMRYLRVMVLYPEVSRYSAKAMFRAGVCFLQLADINQDEVAKTRGRKLMRQLKSRYPGSVWEAESRRYVR